MKNGHQSFYYVGMRFEFFFKRSFAFFHLAVDGSPPRLEGRPARVHRVHPGSSLRLRCPVASGSRPFRVEWSLDGERIDPATWTQHSFAGPADRTLRVRRVGKEEKGIYTCKVQYMEGDIPPPLN